MNGDFYFSWVVKINRQQRFKMLTSFFIRRVERNTRLNESSTFVTCVLLSENKEYADS